MPVQCLSFVEYDETGWKWRSQDIAMPTWDEIQISICRLDRFQYPFAHLFISENHEDSTQDCLTIVGGEGIYWVALSAGEFEQLRLFDPEKGSLEVDLWISDQGFSDHEFHTTGDLKLVLRIAKHFGETGQPLPEASWEV